VRAVISELPEDCEAVKAYHAGEKTKDRRRPLSRSPRRSSACATLGFRACAVIRLEN
jgi:hypothetical protein